ncbi:MAG: hypothetical protein RIS70_3654 [Planctomycetota bacterium]
MDLVSYELTNGLHMRVQSGGTGVPLLFVHGFPLDHSMWSRQADELSDSFQAVIPDLRGFGGTPPLPGVASMAVMADDLVLLLDKLAIPQVVLVGLSMGGYVAWQFWSRYRSRLQGLVLCDTRAGADTAETAKGRRMMAERVRKEGCEFLVETMVPRLFAASTMARSPEIVDSIQRVIRKADPEGVAAALLGMAERPDMTGQLSRVDLPSLIICGESDVISPPSEMRSIAAVMPQARYVEIPDAGHLAPLEQSGAVNDAIREFVLALS